MTALFKGILVLSALAISFNSSAQTAEEWFAQGETSYQSGDFKSALSSFEKAIKEDDEKGIYYKRRGDCRLRMKLEKTAMSDFAKAEKYGYTKAPLYMSRGAAKMKSDDIRGALLDFTTAIEKDSTNANAWYNRACLHYLKFDLDKCIADFDEAIALNPDFAEAFYYRGIAKSEDKKIDAGIVDIEYAMKMDTTLYDGYLSIAIIQYEQKNYEGAIENLDKHVATTSELRGQSYFYRGESKFAIKDKEGACEDWQEAGKLGDMEGEIFYVDYCLKKKEKKPSRRRGNRGIISF